MLQNILSFFGKYSTEIMAAWGAILTLAVVIIKITPNKKDDKILEALLKALSLVNLNPLDNEEEKKEEELKKELEDEIHEMDSDRTRDSLITKLK